MKKLEWYYNYLNISEAPELLTDCETILMLKERGDFYYSNLENHWLEFIEVKSETKVISNTWEGAKKMVADFQGALRAHQERLEGQFREKDLAKAEGIMYTYERTPGIVEDFKAKSLWVFQNVAFVIHISNSGV